ncbi:DUF485 domain-containing protein [Tautonia plasticadhaerens]|uniref:DUF485 domain-containing protein n=1 Tax=Tautonia plasticadhaerens TaxID=2527974 RepID=A0A518HCT6_9BACT|nr:DUF485 domain-containing protein [Tautonia plasticadhaerens]QDV38633.1 hypothetical protein ElP_65880 [Tautonia plasticadhaerens]
MPPTDDHPPGADAPAGAAGQPHDDEHPDLISAHAKAGLRLFAVYLALYGAFVGVNAFAPGVMASRPTGGLNLAVAAGLGLIVAAAVLALVYMALCKRIADRHRAGGGGR